MKNRVEKLICAAMCATTLLSMAVPAYADTVHFDITAVSDPKSKRLVKSGQISNTAEISPGYARKTATYRMSAPSGDYYYMSAASNTNNLHVTGNYTP